MDTSALVAAARHEPGADVLYRELAQNARNAVLPAPVISEFHRVMAGNNNKAHPIALELLAKLQAKGAKIQPFDEGMAELSVVANERFGSGNGLGGKLNLLDLMVYAAACKLGMPILCTGKDFLATDAEIHPASRVG